MSGGDSRFFLGHDQPRQRVGDQAYARRREDQEQPDDPDQGHVHVEILREAAADASDFLVAAGKREAARRPARLPGRVDGCRSSALGAVAVLWSQFNSALGTEHVYSLHPAPWPRKAWSLLSGRNDCCDRIPKN